MNDEEIQRTSERTLLGQVREARAKQLIAKYNLEAEELSRQLEAMYQSELERIGRELEDLKHPKPKPEVKRTSNFTPIQLLALSASVHQSSTAADVLELVHLIAASMQRTEEGATRERERYAAAKDYVSKPSSLLDEYFKTHRHGALEEWGKGLEEHLRSKGLLS